MDSEKRLEEFYYQLNDQMIQLETNKEKIIRHFIRMNRNLNALQDTIYNNKPFIEVTLMTILNHLNNLTSLPI